METSGSTSKKAIKSESPWSVQMKKVKGHATEEQVIAGQVQRQHKEGNDHADAAADKRSTEQQQY